MNTVIDRTVHFMRRNSSIAVNCLSGRGRSGTFSALAIARANQATSLTDLVNIIVAMRLRRDSVVETPAQFRYIARMAGLPDSGSCSSGLCEYSLAEVADKLYNGNRDVFMGVAIGIGGFITAIAIFVCLLFPCTTSSWRKRGYRVVDDERQPIKSNPKER
jgi:Protein-tyrosine phosphatase